MDEKATFRIEIRGSYSVDSRTMNVREPAVLLIAGNGWTSYGELEDRERVQSLASSFGFTFTRDPAQWESAYTWEAGEIRFRILPLKFGIVPRLIAAFRLLNEELFLELKKKIEEASTEEVRLYRALEVQVKKGEALADLPVETLRSVIEVPPS